MVLKPLLGVCVALALLLCGGYLNHKWSEYQALKEGKALLEQRLADEVAERDRIEKEAEDARSVEADLRAQVKQEKEWGGYREEKFRKKEAENEELARLLADCRISTDSLRR